MLGIPDQNMGDDSRPTVNTEDATFVNSDQKTSSPAPLGCLPPPFEARGTLQEAQEEQPGSRTRWDMEDGSLFASLVRQVYEKQLPWGRMYANVQTWNLFRGLN